MKFNLCLSIIAIGLVGLAVSDPIQHSSDLARKQVEETFKDVVKAVEIKCNTNSECNNGQCGDNKVCQCNLGFVNYDDKACSYEQKNKVTAFLLSLFLGNFGADWFYLAQGNSNYNWAGVFKMFLGLFVVVGSCFMCCAQMCCQFLREGKAGVVVRIVFGGITTVCSLANLIWWFVDWIRILRDTFPDGNGVGLKPW